MGTRQESKPGDIVDWCFRFFPFDTGIFDPEAGVMMFAPVGHSVRVEELNSKVEAAHLSVFLHVSDQFILKAVRITPLQGPRRIVRGRYSRILHDVDLAHDERVRCSRSGVADRA